MEEGKGFWLTGNFEVIEDENVGEDMASVLDMDLKPNL
jgi:hypothetical protein